MIKPLHKVGTMSKHDNYRGICILGLKGKGTFEKFYFRKSSRRNEETYEKQHNDYALINRARGPYEEIFVLTFNAYGSNAVRSMRLEFQNKYFPYGPKSRLIKALLYTYTNKIVNDEILLS